MSKPTMKRTRQAATPANGGAKAENRHQSDHTSKQTGSRSKQSCVVAMLRTPAGTTIDAIMKATGWQPHSVRGFLAGVVRKRLKLKLSSKKVDGKRVYQISSDSSKPTARAAHSGPASG